MTSLLAASVEGHLEIVKYLVEEAGADVEAKDKSVSPGISSINSFLHLCIRYYNF